MTDHRTLSPDDQSVVLSIVAEYADAGTFAQLHGLAKAAGNEPELERYYMALMAARDPALATQAAQIALSPEIPPQADSSRVRFIGRLAQNNPKLAWQVFRDNSEKLLAPFAGNGPFVIAQYVPQLFWDGATLTELESWIRAHVPAEMGTFIDRGVQKARFELDQKQVLVAATDAYLHGTAANQRVAR
jgi:aminopeptidase N